MKKIIRYLSALMIIATISIASSISCFALTWDGSSAGGSGGGSPAGPNGYAIRTTSDNCLGYRFSVVNKNGNNKVSKVVDVFRNTSYGNFGYSSDYKFTVKYNKKQIINNQNNSFGTSSNTTNCYKEVNMGFATVLPVESGMGTWQNNTTNLNAVLYNLGIGNIGNLVNGDKVLVEPLYDVRLQSVYHSVTTTELAIYGKYILGASSNGGSSSTSASWGFISTYTNKNYPNALFTTNGQGLWTGVSALGSRGTFYNIINQGYGAGIAYTETKPDFSPNLSVNVCEAWNGSLSTRNFHYGTSNGSAFGNYTYANDYPILNDTVWFAVNFLAESQATSVRQYVRLQGGSWTTRDVTLNGSSWFDVALSPITVDSGRSSYIVEAKMDWMSGSTVLKSGAVKTFYIPVRPKINRTQVTMYNIQGTQVAMSGTSGSSGYVYVGQQVNTNYTFISSNTWTSSNNFSNTINGTSDLHTNGSINQNSSFNAYSNLGYYRVPNLTSIPCKLSTAWQSDTSRTSETTQYNISAIKADIAISQIYLIDSSGYYVSTLTPGQTVTPQYLYTNNSNCTVYVNGYNNDRTQISGTYVISPNSSIYVNGKQITAPSSGTISVWGGVYLDGAGIYNTSWEPTDTTSQNNNSMTQSWNVQVPTKIQVVQPNSLYREGVQVMTSFIVQNQSSVNLIPTNNISVRFTAYKGGSSIYTSTQSGVVIPAYGSNLVYFKWTIPTGLNGANITLKGEIINNGYIDDTQTLNNGSSPYPISQTPDTAFAKKAPTGFTLNSPPSRTDTQAMQWSQWIYSGNSFVKQTYGLNLDTTSKPVIVPDANSPSRTYKNGTWYMKSGYGFTENWNVLTQTLSGTLTPPSSAYTSSQLALSYFPEFGYSQAIGSFRVLDKTAANTFQLPMNPNGKNARLHFVPLWFPDTNYMVQSYVSDIWTPAGMISGYMNSAPIVISQSAYDDWLLGR